MTAGGMDVPLLDAIWLPCAALTGFSVEAGVEAMDGPGAAVAVCLAAVVGAGVGEDPPTTVIVKGAADFWAVVAGVNVVP